MLMTVYITDLNVLKTSIQIVISSTKNQSFSTLRLVGRFIYWIEAIIHFSLVSQEGRLQQRVCYKIRKQ